MFLTRIVDATGDAVVFTYDASLRLVAVTDAAGQVTTLSYEHATDPRYTHAGREAFFADPMAQDAVVRNIEIMGEATRAVSEALKKAHPEIPWRGAFRHGGYDNADQLTAAILKTTDPG